MTVFRDDLVLLLPELRAVARSLTRGNGPLADDVVQDALLSALKCQHQFTPGTNLKAWLFTIVRNKFLSAVSRKHVTAEVHEEDLEHHHWVAPEQESRIEVLAFQRAFKMLSLVHREVLVLAVVQGLPYAEIALLCGCEVGTVKSRANRARAALKHLLLDDDDNEPAASPRSVEAEAAGGRTRHRGEMLVSDPFGGPADAGSRRVGVTACRAA
jgi:RNA polymerase sigma-70 factor, ECF subfamily